MLLACPQWLSPSLVVYIIVQRRIFYFEGEAEGLGTYLDLGEDLKQPNETGDCGPLKTIRRK